MSRNLATKYAKQVDERFVRESQAMMGLNNNYDFTGAETVKVYSIPVVPMTDYKRTGSNRYGVPNDLTRNVQTLTVTRDRAFTFIIDKGDKTQSMMVMDAGKALSRQLQEVWVPEFDSYVFRTLANAAVSHGGFASDEITKANAYEMFLKGQEHLGNRNVPDKGRVCFCSYRFANMLKQDPAFVKYGDKSQDMVIKGVIGEVDGCKIVKVPSSRLPAGAAFLLVHPSAATAPKQLEAYKTHDDPPGISGWLVEGRVVYDCFVLNEKADGVYYHGDQGVLKLLTVMAAPTDKDGEARIIVTTERETGNDWFYTLGDTAENIAYGETVSGWAFLSESGATVSLGSGKVITVVETDADGKVKALGSAPVA